MKSNEEFIAGIYEKAAVYKEENDTKIIPLATRRTGAARVMKIAAMFVVCLGLAGSGVFVLGKTQNQGNLPKEANGEYGIALLSENGEEAAGAETNYRRMPVAETVTFTGVVESVDKEENRIWLVLQFDETAPEYAEGSRVCIRWDLLSDITEDITEGVTVTATGALSVYENATSEYYGAAELVLTDAAELKVK